MRKISLKEKREAQFLADRSESPSKNSDDDPVVREYFHLLNQSPAHKFIFNVRVVDRRRDETGDAKRGFHDEHRQQ